MDADQLRVSPRLQAFVDEYPFVRAPILDLMRRAAVSAPKGSRVVDVGAGDAPYRELFAHCDYVTVDWEHSVHAGAKSSSLIAAADALGLPDASVDVVLLTEVLEHVAVPSKVLSELHRVLKPGGRLYITVPFVWELHEMPHDYWRFTPVALHKLLAESGFDHVAVEPRNDCFSTVSTVLKNIGGLMGSEVGTARGDQGELRRMVVDLFHDLAIQIAKFGSLDRQWVLPLGYAVSAERPANGENGIAVAPDRPGEFKATERLGDAHATAREAEETARQLSELARVANLWIDGEENYRLREELARLEARISELEGRNAAGDEPRRTKLSGWRGNVMVPMRRLVRGLRRRDTGRER